jgi:hypothetical protein
MKMAMTYQIFIVNQSETTQVFWCFLAPPPELAHDPGVFANSSASLAVVPNNQGSAYFGIPVQYLVGAGASNQAVGLNVMIVSDVSSEVSLQQRFDVDYATWPPNMGPTMSPSGASSPNTIALTSNAFDQAGNEAVLWFSNMSFGIQSETGFTGATWSPTPQTTRTLTPTLTFHIAIGEYDSNVLASWDQITNNSIAISIPNSFEGDSCTVTLLADGGWAQVPGRPETETLTSQSKGRVQTDVVQSVHWNQMAAAPEGLFTYLSGTLTVSTALGAAFTFFVLSGVQFSIVNSQPGQTTFAFRYSGTRSARAVMGLFRAGAQLALGDA